MNEVERQPPPPGKSRVGKILLYVVSAFLGSVLLAAVIFSVIAWRWIRAQEKELFDNTEAAQYAEPVANDLALVKADPFFQDVLKAGAEDLPAADAGLFLNRMLSWAGPGLPPGGAPAAGGLDLPNGLSDQIADWDREWLTHAEDFDPTLIDFGWMAELKKYRYWSLEVDSPLGDALAQDPALDPIAFPAPEGSILDDWVKLRLLSAFRDSDPVAALEDVRQLAFLCLTTPSIIREMVGLSYLSQLNKVTDKLKVDGKLPANWRGVPQSTVVAAHRALWALPSYIDFSISDEVYGKVFGQGPSVPGICAALDERLPFMHFSREMLGPFYADRFSRFDGRLKVIGAGCRGTAAQRDYASDHLPLVLKGNLFETLNLGGNGDAPMGGVMTASSDGSQWQLIKKLPPLRQAFGLILARVAKPGLWGAYKEAEAPGEEDEPPTVLDP